MLEGVICEKRDIRVVNLHGLVVGQVCEAALGLVSIPGPPEIWLGLFCALLNVETANASRHKPLVVDFCI